MSKNVYREFLEMKEEVISEIERVIKNLGRKDVLAAGLFGSLVRRDFKVRRLW
jgi:predicted nucleotidyltransferase